MCKTLKSINQWLCWQMRDGNKIPLDWKADPTGSTCEADYMPYAKAVEWKDHFFLDGVAFCFTRTDRYGGIDLDNCIDDDGLTTWAGEILQKFEGCYMEVSPSGTGIKIYGEFTKAPNAPCAIAAPDGGRIEIYDFGRFFCFTGRWSELAWAGEDVRNVQNEVDWLMAKYFPIVERAQTVDEWERAPIVATPDDTLLRVRAARYVASCPLLGENQGRNIQAFKLAGSLRALRDQDGHGLTESEVAEFVHQWNNACPQPLPHHEIERCVWNSANRGNPPAPKLADAQPDIREELASVREMIRSPEADQPKPDSLLFDIADVVSAARQALEDERILPLDTGLVGFELSPGRMTILGGGPGSGKTTLAMQLVTEALLADHEQTAMIVNVEMQPVDLVARLVTSIAGVSAQAYTEHVLDADDMAKVQTAFATLEQLSGRLGFLSPPFSMQHVGRVYGRVRPTVVVLDYIQRITPLDEHHDDATKGLNATIELARAMCLEGTCVFAISALNRDLTDKKGGYSKVSQTRFRGSSEMEYGADEAWILVRDVKEPHRLRLSHQKARYRATRDIELEQKISMKITPFGVTEWQSSDEFGEF